MRRPWGSCLVRGVCFTCKERPQISGGRDKEGRQMYKKFCGVCLEKKKDGRNSTYRKHYNITIQDYDDMYIEQGGCCAICGTHQSKLNRRLAVDHCHDTKEIRGLLCHKCNIGIGCFNDDINIFKNVVKYLERIGG